MRAVRNERPGELGLVDIPAPAAGAGEVVIDVAYAGICAALATSAFAQRDPRFPAVHLPVPGAAPSDEETP